MQEPPDEQARQESSRPAERAAEALGAESLTFHAISQDERQSALKKYQLVHIGNYRMWPLLRYELLNLLVGPLPGLLGLFLRQKLYPSILGNTGRGAIFGRGVVFRQPSKIEIGSGSVIDDYCMLNVRGGEDTGIRIRDNVFIGRNTYINTRDGQVEIDDYANISSNVRIGAAEKVYIGKHVLVAAFCYIGGVNHRIDRIDIPIASQGTEFKGDTVIEEDVWLGAGVCINSGVRVGRGSVIGAGSVVTKDIPPYSIAYGAPARVVKSRLSERSSKSGESAERTTSRGSGKR